MHQIDDNFLDSLGLAALPQNEKEKLKAHIYETLEMRVGMKLASNMSEDQLNEFEGFMSGDVAKAITYLSNLNPDWAQDQAYVTTLENARKQAEATGATVNENAITTEYAALKWLETNFPNYKQVVSDELSGLKDEISQAAPQILAAAGQ